MTEVGIWVSGFYGSGKSSFTKYLGASLDPGRTVQESPSLISYATVSPATRSRPPCALSPKNTRLRWCCLISVPNARGQRRRAGLHRALLEGAAVGGILQREEDRTARGHP